MASTDATASIPAMAAALRQHGATLFGSDRGCQFTEQAKKDWGKHLGTDIQYIACDAGGDSKSLAACADADIQVSPTLVVAGAKFPGYRSPAEVRKILDWPAKVADQLVERNATLYGTDSCKWTRFQRAVLGPHASRVKYVQCNVSREACNAAGVRGYPSWQLDGKLLPGYKPLPELARMVASSDPS